MDASRGPGFADHAKDFAGRYIERHFVDGDQAAAAQRELNPQIADREHRPGGGIGVYGHD